MKKTTTYNLARAAMMLLLVLFTSTAAWADEEFPVPEFSLNANGTSIQVQWNPGDAEAWDIRYRRVTAEGQPQMRWATLMDLDLTERSFSIDKLKPNTEYEVQARASFNDGEDFSDWSPSQTITTGEDDNYDGFDNLDDDDEGDYGCEECEKSQMREIIWVIKAKMTEWYDFDVQIVDAETGTVMPMLVQDDIGTAKGGIAWLCCGRKYDVVWIYDQKHAQLNNAFALSLSLDPGDQIFSMKYGEAPEKSGKITSFIMDCGDYCERRPTNLTVTDVTYKSIELTYNALTETDQIVCTTDPEANPDELRCFEVQKDDKEEETTYTLDDLDPNTTYYIWVRSVCKGENGGYSRWTERLEVRTPGLNATPTQLQAKPKSKKAKLKWKKRGKEKRWKVKLRKQGKGVSVSESQIVTFGFGAGKGFSNTQFGSNVWSSKSSKKANENVLVVGGAHAGDVLTFGARQRESSAGDAKFFVGSQKMDRTMKLDAQAQLFIQQKREAESQAGGGENAIDDMVYMAKTLMRFSRPVKGLPMQARKLAAVADEDEYFFYFRHNEENDLSHLSIEDLMLIPAENQNEWTVISNVTTTEYELKDLEPNTTYEVFVEPIYDDGTTGEGSPISVFTTLGEEAEPLAGAFSVGSGKQVYFSKGNLNYNSHNGGQWSFAEHQYDVRGNGNLVKIGDTMHIGDQVDLFCWSTTGNQYGTTGFAFTEATLPTLFNAPFADWGKNPNLISTLGDGWQTLSQAEWSYLLCQRPNAEERVAYAVVNDISGIVLLPDEWTKPQGISLLTASENGIELYYDEDYGYFYGASDSGIGQINTYSASQWTTLENAGAVFLPAAGLLLYENDGNATMANLDQLGNYWSSTPSSTYLYYALSLSFNNSIFWPASDAPRPDGSAVRLVKPVTVTTPAITLDEANDNRSLLADVDGETCNVTLNRSLLAGSYNTFAAPFDIDAATLADMGIKAKKLVGSTLTDDVLTLTFADATTIEAGHPYLVKLTTDVDLSLLSFDGVTVSQTAVPTQTAVADFVPTLGKTTISGSNATSVLFVGADNTVCHPQSLPADMKGFRAYFQLKGQALTGARRFSLDLGNGETTGIGELELDGQQTAGDIWHALDGRRMTGQPKAKGVYVRKGQTVIMK